MSTEQIVEESSPELVQELCANRMAQWFVQGDYCYIALLEPNLLWLQGIGQEYELTFEQWNGEINLHHGLFWSTIELTSADASSTWWVHGLPSKEAKAFVALLTTYYVRWAKDKVAAFDAALPQIKDTISQFYDSPYYLRQSEYSAMRQSVDSLLKESDLTDELASSFRPQTMSYIRSWFDDSIEERNANWQCSELDRWSEWLDKIESSPLNETQREAVLVNQDHNLILAGAGSGKTSVLVAKAGYLINSNVAEPEQILMLAFGNKAAKEMAERLAVSVSSDIKVATFHRLAMSLIEEATGNKPTVAPFATDEEARMVFFGELMATHFSENAHSERWQKHLERWAIPGLQKNGNWQEGLDRGTVDWLWQRISLLLQNAFNKSQWKQRITETSLATEHQQHAVSELNLLWPVLSAYQSVLKADQLVDFNTMIHQATQWVNKGKVAVGWRSIMVDEYQDISPHRLALIEALTQQGEKPSLFAVGDDWQAIYRFAGADVALTTGFEQRYPDGHIGVLDTTYRFNNMLGDVANRFVQENKAQLTKKLQAHRQVRKKAVVILNQHLLEQELTALAKQKSSKGVSVLLLGRTHKQQPSALSDWQTKWPELSLHYMTCHASKGQQADYVFILNVDQRIFPMKARDLGMMKVLQHEDTVIAHAEERRLFYVALTRAKRQVWVCATPDSPSQFVEELISNKYPVVNKLRKGK